MENPWKAQSKVNPQRDNGHRRINTEIWQALTRVEITSSAYKIIMCVIDRSWGYDQLEASIGYATFVKSTGLSKVSIRNGINEAEKKHILVVNKGTFKESAKYLFNKHYDTWEGLPVKDINTGKPQPNDPVKHFNTPPGIPLIASHSLPTENIQKTKREKYIKGNVNKKEKYGKNEKQWMRPDRENNVSRFFSGKYGHCVES